MSDDFYRYFGLYNNAKIGVAVYKVQPVTYIATARAIKASQYRRPIEDFNWEANIKELSQAELNKARPVIEGSIDELLKKALQNANVIASRPLG